MKTKLLRVLAILFVFLSPNVFGQGMCMLPSREGVVRIYENGLLTGWDTSGSWGVSTLVSSSVAGQHDTYSMKVDFLTAWSGVELHNPFAVMTGRTALVVRLRKELAGGDILVGIHKSSGGVAT